MWNRKRAINDLHETFGGVLKEGTWGQGPYLVVTHKTWQLVFDYYVVSTGQSAITYTRLRTVFNDLRKFELKLAKEGVFAKINKAFGGQDIEIGDESFDSHYIIKSNDEVVTRRLLNHEEVKSKINFQKSFHLDIIHKNQMGLKCLEGESGISFLAPYVIKDDHEIKSLIALFESILDVLLELGLTNEMSTQTILVKEKKHAE